MVRSADLAARAKNASLNIIPSPSKVSRGAPCHLDASEWQGRIRRIGLTDAALSLSTRHLGLACSPRVGCPTIEPPGLSFLLILPLVAH